MAAVAAHLSLVVLGAFGECPCQIGTPGELLAHYSELSGADSGYGYFAPGVASPATARFSLVDGAGNTIVDDLPPGISREADIRVEDTVALLEDADDELRERLAASWAATMFSRHPEATSVVIDMGVPRFPKMADVLRGRTPRWRSLYRARVVRPQRDAEDGGAS